LERRNLDVRVVASIGAGMTGFVFVFPFMKAAAEFRQHYYNTGQAGPHIILQAYRSILVESVGASVSCEHIEAIFLALLAILLLWVCIRQFRNGALRVSSAEAVFVVLMAGLPFCWYLLGRFGVHALEIHYVLGALVGISPLAAIALQPLLQGARTGKPLLIALFIAIAVAGGLRIEAARSSAREFMSTLAISPEIKAVLVASPSQPIYFGDLIGYEMARYYEQDPEVRSRMVLVYSRGQELCWDHSDSNVLVAMHMLSFPSFPIVPFESVAARHGDQFFVTVNSHSWDWSRQAFAASNAGVKPLGSAFGGEVVSVRFNP
jgi:hypothetical protein